MEETSPQEKIQEAESKTQNEEEGGIRRRLRDRELLKKRKAEAEEKETNQVESQRKRSRGENKSGTKRRGRPRKTDPVLQFPVILEEAATVAAPAEVFSGQILSSPAGVSAVGSQQPPDVDAPAPVPFPDLVRNSVFGKLDVASRPVPVQDSAQAAPVPVKAPYPALEPVQAPYAAPVPVKKPYAAPVPVQAPYAAPDPVQAPYVAPEPVKPSYAVPIPVQSPDDVPVLLQAPDDDPVEVQAPDGVPVQFPSAAPIRAPSQDPIPAAALAPPRVETLYTESPGRETIDQVLIEDLGPDDEDDISPSQNDRADEDSDETLLTNTAEQNKMYSIPTLSSPPLPQEYLPGNQL